MHGDGFANMGGGKEEVYKRHSKIINIINLIIRIHLKFKLAISLFTAVIIFASKPEMQPTFHHFFFTSVSLSIQLLKLRMEQNTINPEHHFIDCIIFLTFLELYLTDFINPAVKIPFALCVMLGHKVIFLTAFATMSQHSGSWDKDWSTSSISL